MMKKFVVLDTHEWNGINFHIEKEILEGQGIQCILAECKTKEEIIAHYGVGRREGGRGRVQQPGYQTPSHVPRKASFFCLAGFASHIPIKHGPPVT